METVMDSICAKFDKMGARAKSSVDRLNRAFSVDIRKDAHGEFFEVRRQPDVEVYVLDIRPRDRHLLLMARQLDERGKPDISKFLCGHDERHWFVAAVPESAHAKDVQSAKDALKPSEVWDAIRRSGIRMNHRDRRRTDAFVRQGEWFFLPQPRMTVKKFLVLHDEPIRRGGGKPHMCEFLYREGGVQVYVSRRHPNGLTVAQYQSLSDTERDEQHWTTMARDARAYVKGAIRHPDHETIRLDCWHLVVMNTETKAAAMQHVAFLD
jgi:hypothetical protein